MHHAFRPCAVVEIPKERIDVIFAYGDKLLVGTSWGTLRVYQVQEPNDELEVTATLIKTVEKFAKRIEQLAIIKEVGILVALTGRSLQTFPDVDSAISLYELQTFELQEQLAKTKGATVFAITSNIEKDADGVPTIVSRLAVVVKRRLEIYSWHDAELADPEEFSLPDRARTLTWMSSTKLCLGLSSDYTILDTKTGSFSDSFSPATTASSALGALGGMGVGLGYLGSRAPQPLSVQLPDNQLLLVKDTLSTFLDADGKPIERRQIPWKEAPEEIGWTYPYLIALTTKGVGVWNPDRSKLVQQIDIQGAHLLNDGKLLYAASPNQVWRLVPYRYDDQIDELVQQKLYDEAISLLNQVDEVLLKNKEMRLRTIRYLKAFGLFEQRKYDDSMDLFSSVSATPRSVIALFPSIVSGDLAVQEESEEQDNRSETAEASSIKSTESPRILKALPEGVRASLDSPRRLKDTESDTGSIISKHTEIAPSGPPEGKDLIRATLALVRYLADMRFKLSRWLNAEDTNDGESRVLYSLPSESENVQVELEEDTKLETAAELVDTTLFRAYMLCRPQLVGPLVRRPNRCVPSVVQEMLEQAHKYRDLAEFLLGKGLHRQALQLLQSLGQKEEPEADSISISTASGSESLAGPEHTILYLQKLKDEDIDVILEFARWPLEANEEMAMEIFLDDTPEAESLPRGRVLDYLVSVKRELALRYLEHLIHDLNEMSPTFHDRLVSLFLDEASDPSVSAERKSEVREKMVKFLEESEQYMPERALARLSHNDEFLQERAVVLSKMGQHKNALEIFVFKLKDFAKAEKYCIRIYNQAEGALTETLKRAAMNVFHTLLTIYLLAKPTLLAPALDILAKHSPRLDASEALALIPPEIAVENLESFFTKHIRKETSTMNQGRVVSELRKVELLRMESRVMRLRGTKAIVREETVCPYCHKRLGQSVVAVIPEYHSMRMKANGSGSMTHYSCLRSYLKEKDLEYTVH